MYKNIIEKIRCFSFRHYFYGKNQITVKKDAESEISKMAILRHCHIFVAGGSSLKIGRGSKLTNVSICIMEAGTHIVIGEGGELTNCSIEPYKANISIGNGNFIQTPIDSFPVRFRIHSAELTVGDYNSLSCGIWARFGGKITIGNRNAINQRTEIRCDEKVEIGDYNQISYDCVIWDTNTHVIHSAMERRRIVEKEYPCFGLETERPKTKPIKIGDDCWVGRGCSLLKGVQLGDRCIVAYNTILTGGSYTPGNTLMNDVMVRAIPNKV